MLAKPGTAARSTAVRSGCTAADRAQSQAKRLLRPARNARSASALLQCLERNEEETITSQKMASQKDTGTSDPTYNLVSVLYHALQGAETYTQYIRDAEQANDQELAQFFRQTQQEEKRRSESARELLAKRFKRS